MACREQHESHDSGHDHDHDHFRPEDSEGDSLFQYIDTTKIRVLNAMDASKASAPFKPHSQRFDTTSYLDSNEDDPELIIYIPFTESVTIKSMALVGGPDGMSPSTVKLFTNRSDIDFSNASDLPPSQVIEVVNNTLESNAIDYPLTQRKFQGVSEVTLFVTDNYGGDFSRIYYIGFKGQSKKFKHGIVENAVYESRAIPGDHTKVDGTSAGGNFSSLM